VLFRKNTVECGYMTGYLMYDSKNWSLLGKGMLERNDTNDAVNADDRYRFLSSGACKVTV
jgi:hypothetical protein